jgi:DNA-binding response OmpR family regulator
MVPVIVITARDPSEGEKAVELGARSVFHKPFNAGELVAEIKRVLGDGDRAP